MSQGLNKVKRRIAIVENTRKITNAMKLISSVKLRQVQNGYDKRISFYDDLNDTVDTIANYLSTTNDSRLLKSKSKKDKVLYVVVSSSLGLCGSYNYNVIRYFSNIIKKGDEVVVIGEKIAKEMEKSNNFVIDYDAEHILNNLTMSNCRVLAHKLLDKYNTDEYKKVVLVYTKYINQIATKVEEITLLPIQYKPDLSKQIKGPDIEGDVANILDKLTKKYLMNTLFIKLTECILSEQSCRRNAMDNADKNAEEIVDKLKIEYNKARQAAITQEITEVVSGSANKWGDLWIS